MFKPLYILSVLAITLTGCAKDDDVQNNNATTVAQLTQQEIQDLQFIIEEEKLARDVYKHSGTLYSINIFGNISSSEQMHMDRIKSLFDKYGIQDPTEGMPEGQFKNQDLQALYNQLTNDSEESLLSALVVGATIEDLDIFDLSNIFENTSNEDLLSAYNFLLCGSRNHLRGFTDQISNRGENYLPQNIDQELYNEILNAGHENCSQY